MGKTSKTATRAPSPTPTSPQRKRSASDTDFNPAASCAGVHTPISEVATGIAVEEQEPGTVPLEVLQVVAEYLDGNGLLSCERVSYRWRLATDRTHLWKRACLAAFPHLGDSYLDSAYSCCSAYEGDWRETFLDGNRGNRSAVLDWTMEVPGQGGEDADEPERKRFPPFSLCGYTFFLLADPGGNPRAVSQAQAAGAARVEKGLSVYLAVAFPDETLDTPPWDNSGAGFSHPYPPPPLQLGPGHPWGGEEDQPGQPGRAVVAGEDTDSDEGEDWGCWAGRRKGGAVERGVKDEGVLVEKGKAGGSGSGSRLATSRAMAVVPKDPHGLRRRRRRFRRREGRVEGFSHAGESEAIARECCAAFSLAAVNKAGGKDVMWVSSMEVDRFFAGRSSWGVHCLLPTSMIQDPEEGFLKDGNLTVRLRVRLLFLIAHVYTTSDLASHRGFGVVPVRGSDMPFHYHSDAGKMGAAHGDDRPVGPLPCMTFEILRCTTLAQMEALVAAKLNLASTQSIRLWVITQPLTDGPLAPRQLLSGQDMPVRLFDDEQDSPTLFRLLNPDTLDDTCRLRLWVEQRGDAGFWETEAVQPRWRTPIDLVDGTTPRPVPQESFAGVRLVSTTRLPTCMMQSSLIFDEAAYPDEWLYAAVRDSAEAGHGLEETIDCAAPDLSAGADAGAGGGAAATAAAAAAAAAAADSDNEAAVENGAGGASGGGEPPPSTPPLEGRMLVFLKTLGLSGKKMDGSGSSGAEGRGANEQPVYLTHAILRGTSPLRCLFELTADRLREDTTPEELGAYIEELPWAWQGGNGQAFHGRASGQTESGNARGRHRSDRDCPSSSVHGVGSVDGRAAAGPSGSSRHPAATAMSQRRFFACPPPLLTAPPPATIATSHCGLPPGSSGGKAGGPSGCGDARGGYGGEPAISNGSSTAADSKRTETFPSKTAEKPETERLLTLADVGLASGASICFFRVGREKEGEAAVAAAYSSLVDELVEGVRLLLRGEGPLGRVHMMKLPEVVEICESLGYQGFRARIAHDQQQHVNARETLEYVARGRHLAFICDSCGTQDFSGPRYHCLRCPDYDLCNKCHAKLGPAPRHRYLFTEGHWKRESGFHGHLDDHDLEEILPVPSEGCEWRRRHRLLSAS